MFVSIALFCSLAFAPDHVKDARTEIQNIYWQQLQPDSSREIFEHYTERISNYQTEILLGYHQGSISGEEAFDLYQGSLSYLAAGFRKIGWKNAARQIYESALPLVAGTDEEVFFLLNLADLQASKISSASPPEAIQDTVAIFEKIIQLPQFLETSPVSQQIQMDTFLQKAGFEIFIGHHEAAAGTLNAFLDYSYQFEIPLTRKQDVMNTITFLKAKTASKKAFGLEERLGELEKDSAFFTKVSRVEKQAMSSFKTSNFEQFTTRNPDK